MVEAALGTEMKSYRRDPLVMPTFVNEKMMAFAAWLLDEPEMTVYNTATTMNFWGRGPLTVEYDPWAPKDKKTAVVVPKRPAKAGGLVVVRYDRDCEESQRRLDAAFAQANADNKLAQKAKQERDKKAKEMRARKPGQAASAAK